MIENFQVEAIWEGDQGRGTYNVKVVCGGRDENVALILGRRVIESLRDAGCEKPLLLSITLKNRVDEDSEVEKDIVEQIYQIIDDHAVWNQEPR